MGVVQGAESDTEVKNKKSKPTEVHYRPRFWDEKSEILHRDFSLRSSDLINFWAASDHVKSVISADKIPKNYLHNMYAIL